MTSQGDDRWGVLFLCTGNSARSIMAECLLRHWDDARFRAYSAGSDPAGAIKPEVVALLERLGHPTESLHSESVSEFVKAEAPAIDFVITVCDSAAEQCPVFPGQPITAHWGIPDPAAVEGDETARAQAFHRAYTDLERRIQLFVQLPLAGLDRLARRQRIRSLAHPEEQI